MAFSPRTGLWVAALTGVALGVMSLLNLLKTHQLQSGLDQAYALAQARSQLTAPLQRGELRQLSRAVEGLVLDSGLGFLFLAVRDAEGAVLASAGRYENLGSLAPLRDRLYRWRARSSGETSLVEGSRRLGALEYALAAPELRLAHEQAVDQLRWSAWAGFLLSLPLLGFSLRHGLGLLREGPRARVNQRLALLRSTSGPNPGTTSGAPAMSDWPDALGLGVVLVQRDGRVREINRAAEALTGWRMADAAGRPLYSVLHLLAADGATLENAAESCLRDGHPAGPQLCQLRARDGQHRPVEMTAAAQHDAAGEWNGVIVLLRDDTLRACEMDALKREARLSQGVIDHLDEGLVMTDPAGVVRFANARAQRMFGYSREELEGATVTKLMPVPFLNTPGVKLADYNSHGDKRRLPRVAGWRKDATTFPLELLTQPLKIGTDEGYIAILRDISERQRGENLATRLGRLLDNAREEVYIFDAQTLAFLEVNRGARKNLGYKQEELAHMTPLSISQGLDSDTYQGYIQRLRGGDAEHLVYRCVHRRADGSEYPVEVRLNFSRDEEPPVFMAIAVDISERVAVEDKLKHLAHHDPLTGLPNRAVLFDRINQALLGAVRTQREVAVLFVDLDRFKPINDTYGHETGDLILRGVADRLRSVLREADTVARLGGDEFVVLAPGARGPEDAELLARKIIEGFRRPLDIPGRELIVNASVGVTLYPHDNSDAEGLIRHADAAMYQAKQEGRNAFRMFSPELDPQRQRTLELEREIHTAVALNHFHLLLTPVLDATQTVRAVLVDFYWQHPRHGRIDSAETLRAATRAGLLADLELWVIGRACSHYYYAVLRRGASGAAAFIVPTSSWQLRDPEFAAHVCGIMSRFSIPERRLTLALSLDGLTEAREAGAPQMQRLAACGVRLALRGFSENFSVLNQLGGLPLDLLLLSEQATAGAVQDPAALLRILATAQALRLHVVATGLQQAGQQETLLAHAGLLCADWRGALGTREAADRLRSSRIETLSAEPQ